MSSIDLKASAGIPRYVNGRPYAALQARYAGHGVAADYAFAASFDLPAMPDWAAFWHRLSGCSRRSSPAGFWPGAA